LPGIKSIGTYDEHSDIYSKGLVDSVFPFSAVHDAIDATNPSLICFPDKGAEDRYSSNPFFTTKVDHLRIPYCSMSKNRDQKTGYITNMFLNELGINIEGEDVLIWDDICDGGMTFKLTAEKLLRCGAKSVNLYTTHGIYSKGIQTLRDSGISRIFNRKGEVLDE